MKEMEHMNTTNTKDTSMRQDNEHASDSYTETQCRCCMDISQRLDITRRNLAPISACAGGL